MYVFLAAVCNNTHWLWKFGESDAWTLPAENKYFGTDRKMLFPKFGVAQYILWRIILKFKHINCRFQIKCDDKNV
jgi:hypothetical protein